MQKIQLYISFLHFSGCTFCGKQFRQLSTLSNHVKIHTGKFSRVQIQRNWEYNINVNHHMQYRTLGEKPFECVVCKKQFRWAAQFLFL